MASPRFAGSVNVAFTACTVQADSPAVATTAAMTAGRIAGMTEEMTARTAFQTEWEPGGGTEIQRLEIHFTGVHQDDQRDRGRHSKDDDYRRADDDDKDKEARLGLFVSRRSHGREQTARTVPIVRVAVKTTATGARNSSRWKK